MLIKYNSASTSVGTANNNRSISDGSTILQIKRGRQPFLTEAQIFTDRHCVAKRGRLCFTRVCHSVHRGVLPSGGSAFGKGGGV